MICSVLLLQGIGINQNFGHLLGSNHPGSYWAQGPQWHTSRSVLNHFVFFLSRQSELSTCSSFLLAQALQQQQYIQATPSSGLLEQVHGLGEPWRRESLVEKGVLQFPKEIKLKRISSTLKPEWWWRELGV